jgi:hypothetical protein
MPKAYAVVTYRSVSDPEKLAVFGSHNPRLNELLALSAYVRMRSRRIRTSVMS